jgi:hypothetical protein
MPCSAKSSNKFSKTWLSVCERREMKNEEQRESYAKKNHQVHHLAQPYSGMKYPPVQEYAVT